MSNHSDDPRADSKSPPIRPMLRFLGMMGALLLFGFVILPALARHPAMAARTRFLAEKQIDASALYYTDLAITDDLTQQWRRIHRDHPTAL